METKEKQKQTIFVCVITLTFIAFLASLVWLIVTYEVDNPSIVKVSFHSDTKDVLQHVMMADTQYNQATVLRNTATLDKSYYDAMYQHYVKLVAEYLKYDMQAKAMLTNYDDEIQLVRGTISTETRDICLTFQLDDYSTYTALVHKNELYLDVYTVTKICSNVVGYTYISQE